MSGFLPGLSFFLDLILLLIFGIILFINYRWRVKLSKERDTLLQEKGAVLGFVHNVGEVFADAETIDMDSLLSRVLHYAVRTCKASSGAVYLLHTEAGSLEARSISGVFPPLFKTEEQPSNVDMNTTAQLETWVKQTPIRLGEGLIGEAAVLGNSILVEDAEMDARIIQCNASFLKIHTLLIVPMRFGNHTIGVMVLCNRTNGRKFSLSDLNLAQALAAQASVPIHYAGLQETLEEKRQMDRDMQIAQQIQTSLLPRELPQFNGIELAAFNHPALEIGGDYYDFIEIDSKHIGLVIADVSGKGIGGALMMAVCRSVLRVNAPNVIDPSSMLSTLNRILSSNLAEDMFITMLYMVINLETYLLSYARAGHEAPILIRNGDTVSTQAETSGIGIGLVDTKTFESLIETKNIYMRSGDLIVTYTDGISEAMNSAGEEWGTGNLTRAVERMASASAADILENIRNEVLAFTGSNRQSDDMTMLALKIK